MTPLAFVVLTLVVARGTRIVTTDDVSNAFRDRISAIAKARAARKVFGKDVHPNDLAGMAPTALASAVDEGYPPWYVVLLNCDWCIGFWVAALVAVLGKVTGLIESWTWAGWCWPAMAGGAGLTLRWQ